MFSEIWPYLVIGLILFFLGGIGKKKPIHPMEDTSGEESVEESTEGFEKIAEGNLEVWSDGETIRIYEIDSSGIKDSED